MKGRVGKKGSEKARISRTDADANADAYAGTYT
jgi:hypothetical protein